MENVTFQQWKRRIFRSAHEKKILISGHFELTGRCNLNCKMCYVHTLDHCAAKEKELSTEEWKRLFDDAYDQGLMFATLTGGECLLRPDFKELYLHLWKKRVRITVFTNGTLINGEYIAFFKQYQPAYVQISLYGSSEEGYLQVTGHKGFEKTVSAIRALRKAGIDAHVTVTASRYLYEDYIPTLQFCKDNAFPCKPGDILLAPNREDPNKDDYYLSVEQCVELSVRQAALYRTLQPVEDTPPPKGNRCNIPVGLKCNAGSCTASVSWDGKMKPCVTTLVDGFDVRELGFAQAWERTKETAVKMLLPVECLDCAYEKVCVRCPVFRSPKMDGHCDPAICELTRRLVAAGVKKL